MDEDEERGVSMDDILARWEAEAKERRDARGLKRLRYRIGDLYHKVRRFLGDIFNG